MMNEITRHEMNIDTTGTQLTLRPELTPSKWQMILQVANVAYNARLFKGVTSVEGAAMILLKGFELGIGLTASLDFVRIILNSVELIPRGALALMHNHPDIKRIQINRLVDDNDNFVGMSCYIERTNGFAHESSFTLADAQQAGLIKAGSGWEKYPENMCMWRSIGFAADIVAPDICSGMTAVMKMPEHYGVALDEQGDIIDVGASDPIEIVAPQQLEQQPEVITLQQLIDVHGPAKVMEGVNTKFGGRMPATNEEVQQLEGWLQ